MKKQTHFAKISESLPQPSIVYGKGYDSNVTINPEDAAQTMRELGVSEDAIANSTVYIDPKNRIANYGTHYSPRLGRLRFWHVPELKDVTGDIIRLSTTVRGKERTTEQINKTAVHEWEHLAQAERHDRKVTEGHIAIYGLAAIGALVGNRLAKSAKGKSGTAIGSAIGGFIGYQLGYRLAPHERQARLRAGQVRGLKPQVTSKSIMRKPKN